MSQEMDFVQETPHLRIYRQEDLESFISFRDKETKAGEKFRLLESINALELSQSLSRAFENQARYAVVLIPEDIGPRANHGRVGSDLAPRAFMKYFSNLQDNKFIDYSKVLLLGEIEVQDLMESSENATIETLRALCQQIDSRVSQVLEEIFRARLEPIIIGGGNNNSLPILRALQTSLSTNTGIACVNCDPHADFRPVEGRHSGNGFRYAYEEGILQYYCVFGMHESYNSQNIIEALDRAKFPYFTYEDFAIRSNITFEQQIEQVKEYLRSSQCPIGLELDLDSIIGMPSSAKTPAGISVEQALAFIHAIASSIMTRYLHLSEGAPQWAEDGEREVGKTLALCAATYIKAREQSRRRNTANFEHVIGKRHLLKESEL